MVTDGLIEPQNMVVLRWLSEQIDEAWVSICRGVPRKRDRVRPRVGANSVRHVAHGSSAGCAA